MSREKSNMPIMILLSVCVGVLLGLIIYGAFLLIKVPKGSEVVPTMVEASKENGSHQSVAKEPAGESLEPLVVSTPTPMPIPTSYSVPAIERADEQPRHNSPNRDSIEQPEVMARNDFVLIDSDVTLTNEEELDALENWQIRVARNEIFARVGRIFESQDMKEYFDNQEWYEGIIPAATFDAKRDEYMNAIELENMNIITKYEKDHGINQ